MKGFVLYFTLQMKRVIKIFPTVLCTMVLLGFLLAVSVFALMKLESESDKMLKVKVGIVGEIDRYMGLDIEALVNVLSAKFGAEFVSVSEEEAKAQMHAGKMTAYVLVPEDLVDSIVSGENNSPITYVASEGQKGISGIVMDEVVGVISELITCPQSSILGMQNYLRENDRREELWPATDELNLIYIGAVANIYHVGTTEIVGMANQVSAGGYYVCSVLVIFLLLCGLNCGSLFTRKKNALCKLLASKGQNVKMQVLGEYLAYFLMVSLFFVMILSLVYVVKLTDVLPIKELSRLEFADYLLFACKLMPVVAVITAMQFMLYELVDNIVSSILVQFLLAVAMGYVAGCYYPLSFFPKVVQKFGELTPVGNALVYADKCLIQEGAVKEILLLCFYLVIFLLLSVWGRKRRVENEAGI